jgi:hypothetical protein
MVAFSHAHPLRSKEQLALVGLEGLIAVNAVGGAWYGLGGAPEIPKEWLEGTPFESYLVPSLVLLVAVGGGMTWAAVSLLAGRPRAPAISVAAGVTLMAWIAGQVAMIGPRGGFSWLQPSSFAAGALVAVMGWRLRSCR